MAEGLEDYIRLHRMTPDQSSVLTTELAEYLIGLVRDYLK
jgi:hypothetical protein